MKKSIVWLASYPKSGNTWMRIFLANYLMNLDKPVPINQTHRFGLGDSIPKMYQAVAGRPVDLRDHDVSLALRDKVLEGIVRNNADVNFVKTHNVRGDAFGVPLIPERFTRSAIYILRNPLDMVLSYARHYGMDPAQATEAIGRLDNANSPDQTTVWQFLSSWSDHVKGWTARASYPVCVVRYEDMLDQPQKTFGKVLEHIGISVQQDRLDKAIRFSSFDEVKKQEDETGFVEHPGKAERFFNKGKSGQWETDLDPELVERIRREHRNTMKLYGYL